MKIRYKCKDCLADRVVEVPKRELKTPVDQWINFTVLADVYDDHIIRNTAKPCAASAFDLMIPMPPNDIPIGTMADPNMEILPLGDWIPHSEC